MRQQVNMVRAERDHLTRAWYAIHDENGKPFSEPILLSIVAQLIAERDYYRSNREKEVME